jgi:AraC-like DNA-binding protein
MDPLSDLLRTIRLEGAYFYAVEAAAPWSIETVAAHELSPRIMPHAEHLISYHILTDGTCFGGLDGAQQYAMEPGDVIVFPHGDSHLMSSAQGLRIGPDVNSSTPARFPETVILGEHGPRTASFVCGFLGCDLRPFNPLLSALPRTMHMRGVANTGLGAFTRQIAEQSRGGRAGADMVLTRLAELMFIEVVRRYLDELPAGQIGWLAGLRDEVVGRVLLLIHGRPGFDWNLADLARESSSSRSIVAKRFTEIVGQPPMHYLTQWRMQLAANLLLRSSAKVATIGADVGYDSEAAFSRAFKKATGESPAIWRSAHRRAAG